MNPPLTLAGKLLRDVRWSLLFSVAALFALGWLFVYATSLNESNIRKLLTGPVGQSRRADWLRTMGVDGEAPSSASIMAGMFWNHPFIVLIVAVWAVGRGSGAVGAEIERGTLDLVLSRPISRTTYLSAQVVTSLLGMLLIAVALAAGAAIAARYNVLNAPPGFGTLLKPALNLAALGVPIYGYSLFFSAIDHVRWRPTMLGSVATLAGFIARVIAVIPVFKDMSWRPWVDRASIFRLYNPVDAVTARELYAFNLAVLCGLGAGFIALAYLVFAARDLPANG
jgi:ABC-2 type transport system permease protein